MIFFGTKNIFGDVGITEIFWTKIENFENSEIFREVDIEDESRYQKSGRPIVNTMPNGYANAIASPGDHRKRVG